MAKETISMFGVSMHPWTMQDTISEINRRLNQRTFTQHVVVNVAKLVQMQHDKILYDAVSGCDIVNIDGAGIVFGGRILGLKIPERVAGIDLYYSLLQHAEQNGFSVYFLGARADIIERTVSRIRTLHPNLQIAGYHHGYFWGDEKTVVEKVNSSGADLLFVGISSPMKEQFITKWREQLGVTFAMGVGGTFDIVAGKTKRAPVWMQKVGLEWFYRVLQEPRRMYKRYLVTNSIFFWMLAKAKIRQII